MKITKSRLLQIIREEVELHEKNTFDVSEEELHDSSTKDPLPTDDQGNLSKKDKKKVLDDAEQGKMEEADVDEDQLIDPQSKEVIEPPKKSGKIEIKIR